jgi:hypothetical protein
METRIDNDRSIDSSTGLYTTVQYVQCGMIGDCVSEKESITVCVIVCVLSIHLIVNTSRRGDDTD